MNDASKGAGEAAVTRYECKYFVPERVAQALRDRISPFCRPDRFAAPNPGYSYQVCSLYLDSRALALYRMAKEGLKDRFKLRIRYYDDNADQPAFVEIKRRRDQAVVKLRQRVSREDALAMTAEPNVDRLSEVGEEFASLVRRLDATPVLRVKYDREAYVAADESPVRVTFDRNLEQSCSPLEALTVTGGRWDAVRTDGVILEIKFSDSFPTWIRGSIDAFELQKQSIPKYGMCVDGAISDGTWPPGGAHSDDDPILRSLVGR